MKIGALAHEAGVGIDTVRYYERNGLLPPAPREASGYRRFDRSDVMRLHFIRRAKASGFTLVEIRELLALSGRSGEGMSKLKAVAEARLAALEVRLAELTSIRDGLRTLVQHCPGQGTIDNCPILDALAGQRS